MMKKVSWLFCLYAVMVMLTGAETAQAVVCSSVELNVCTPALVMSSEPSKLCCQKAMEQRPCYCEFLRDPNLKQFFSNAADRRLANACGFPYPVCGY
ncbi:Nonspecific lipid-transfer protein, putative, partial [Ricinus communis]